MGRRDEYREYLRSGDWRSLSMLARFRASNRCELCGAHGDHVHHVRYPKKFKDDNIDNLIVLCEFHHAMIHGIRGEFMASEMTIVSGVETTTDEDGGAWFCFEQIFRKLHEFSLGDKDSRSIESTMNRAMSGALGQIRDKYKRVETIILVSGEKRLRYWINEPGVHQLAAKWDTRQTQAFQDWLYEDLLPTVRKTGGYQAVQSSGDAIIDLGNSIQSLAASIVQARTEALETRKIADEAATIAVSAERKVDDAVRRLDEMTGGDFYMTARLACLKCGVDPNAAFKGKQTNAMALGAWCADQARRRGLSTAPKIAEGTFIVNQFSKELLREGVRHLGFVNRGVH